jgi:hypothetical protein
MGKRKKSKHKGSRAGRTSRRVLSREEVSIAGEVSSIIRLAQEQESRVVTLGPLVFFSTETGDAWMLDPEDGLALCLAREGEPLPVEIRETAETFAIGWNSQYLIRDGLFVVRTSDGRETAIYGYPTDQIAPNPGTSYLS